MKKIAQRLAQIIPSASMAMAQKVITGEQNRESGCRLGEKPYLRDRHS